MTGFRIPAFVCAFVLSLLLAVPSSPFPGARSALRRRRRLRAMRVTDRSCSLPLPGCAPIWSRRSPPRALCRRSPTSLAEGASCRRRLARTLPGHDRHQPADAADRRPGRPSTASSATAFSALVHPISRTVATWTDSGLIQADTLPQAAERAGKQVVSVGWEGVSALDPPLERPGRRWADAVFPIRGGDERRPAPISRPTRNGTGSATTASICGRPRVGRRRRSRSARRRRPTSPSARSIAAGPNPDRNFAVYIYDSTDDATTNYDRVLVAPEKDAAGSVADLASGAWAGSPGRADRRAGRPGGGILAEDHRSGARSQRASASTTPRSAASPRRGSIAGTGPSAPRRVASRRRSTSPSAHLWPWTPHRSRRG